MRFQLAFAAELRAALRSLVPSEHGEISLEVKAAMNSTMFWNTPSVRITYFERSMAGCIRFQHRGSSELMIFPPAALEASVFT